MLERMVFNLVMPPLTLLLFAVVAAYMFGEWIPSRFVGMFAQFGVQFASIAPWVSGGLLTCSLISGANNALRFWRWYQGDSSEECCCFCGGLVNQKDGRYGLYYKCLACGKTRSV
jgi:hypothetical protein